MLLYEGKQYHEGIDSIDLMIQPYLYGSLDLSKQLDPYQRVSIFSTMARIPQNNGLFAYLPYYYLHISGEYINPELPVKETIAIAITMLMRKNILIIKDAINGLAYNEASTALIKNNLSLFVTGISGIEFCFDFKEENVKITKDAVIINVSDNSFLEFLRKKQKDRPHYLIKEESTYYSYDYNKRRKSTLKLYNRETWLLKKNNEYSKDFIKNNPYKMRIEFVFKKHYNSSYITVNNIDGTYYQIIERFIPYLAKLYRKYFWGKVSVDPSEHRYFSQIYSLAWYEKIRYNNNLENAEQERKINNRDTEFQKYYRLMNTLKRYKIKNDKISANPPNNYFVDYKNITPISPFDLQDYDKISFKDGDFTFFKDNWIYPEMKTIENGDENE
jgi:hypothetical protein